MLCTKYINRKNATTLFNSLLKAYYSRRNDRDTNSYKVVKTDDTLDEVDNTVFGTDTNWELLTPRGFRFYLPGSIGPGWLDITTTAQATPQYVEYNNEEKPVISARNKGKYELSLHRYRHKGRMLHFVAQECPILLRSGIVELFPGCIDVISPHLTVVTVTQRLNVKVMKRSREAEIEKLAKYFLLAASNICTKLKFLGYWADFINPFSGHPYFNVQKTTSLYKTDPSFRCLGFKIYDKNNCKVISRDKGAKNFIGSLYTTAPASMEFLREIINDLNTEE